MMLEPLRLRAWWREQRPAHATPEAHLPHLCPEAIEDMLRSSRALQWRSWLEQHAPTLVGWVGLDDVERLEDGGYQFTSEAAEATWRYPELTPRTYFTAGWTLLDREAQQALSLARSWTRTRPLTAGRALRVLSVAARIEEVIGKQVGRLPLERWFVEEEHLRAQLRETTSYRLLKRHGERLGFVIEREEGWDERGCGERFMQVRICIVPPALA